MFGTSSISLFPVYRKYVPIFLKGKHGFQNDTTMDFASNIGIEAFGFTGYRIMLQGVLLCNRYKPLSCYGFTGYSILFMAGVLTSNMNTRGFLY